MAEAVTLAHVARPHVLACSLPPDQFEVLFASDPRFERLFQNASYGRQAIHSVSTKKFLQSLAQGTPLYDLATLQDYVREDLQVIDAFQPDLIVGDFRLSLSVSARLRSVPYVSITNAYWSPRAKLECPVPELPLTRWMGYRLGGFIFDKARGAGFAMHARAHNRLRRFHGIRELGHDVREVYVDGDHVLFADLAELLSLPTVLSGQHFIGPIRWSPEIALPNWWSDSGCRKGPVVYVTVGSSGDTKILPELVSALSSIAGTVLVATAGRSETMRCGGNVFVADYLPGGAAAERADIVVCNGGSPTAYQALEFGKPVIGIPSNLDQCLNMAMLRDAGLATILRVGRCNDAGVRIATETAFAMRGTRPLETVARQIRETDPGRSLVDLITTVV